MRKKVSVVVPCYNAAQFLDQCMEGLLNQSIGLGNIEIILVDDASTDEGKTLGKIMQYERRFPENIIAIPLEQNMRQGGARNVGICYATGEYLMFCDADDYLSLCAMERLYNAARKYQADVVEYRMKKIYEYSEIGQTVVAGDKSYLLDMTDGKIKRLVMSLSQETFCLGCVPKFYRMDMIQEYNIRFAEHLIYEEPSFTVPVRIYEKRHFFLDEELYFYFQSPDSTMRGENAQRQLDNLKVWLILMEELEQRGLKEQYYDELGKMFYEWAFLLSLNMMCQKGNEITREIFLTLKTAVLELFPNIRQNPGLSDEQGTRALGILDMDYEEGRQEVLRQMLYSCSKTF